MITKLNEVKLYGTIYKILYRYVREDDSLKNNDGYIDHDLKGIIIAKSLKRKKKDIVLIHELLHLIEDEQKIQLTETQVDALATGFVNMLNENNLNITKKRQRSH
jgi:Zn-dependent peptidase ImmA (M78 family)